MSSIWIFGFVLFVAGGVIAYVGDRLGTYVGKKRISKLGLRPKHTAMLYTIVAGGVVAVLTLFALIAVDRSVQTALVNGRAIVRNNAALKLRNQRLLSSNARLERQIVVQQQQVLDGRVQVAEADREVKVASDQVAASRIILNQTKAILAQKEQAVVASQKSLQIAQVQLLDTKHSLRATGAQLETAKRNVSISLRSVKIAQAQLEFARIGLQEANVQVASLTKKGMQLASDNQELLKKKQSLMEVNSTISYATQKLATDGLIYRKGQDLGRLEIKTDQSEAAIEQQLDKWLEALSAEAEAAGAVEGKNERAVQVEADMQRDPSSKEPWPDEHDNIAELADSIAGERGVVDSVVVVAYAHYNSPSGEQTRIVMKPYANILCFKQGQSIANCVVDGSQSPETIWSTLSSFLMTKVRPIAAKAGIIPTYDAKTGQRSYGGIVDDPEIYKQIQELGSDAVVTVVADSDTYASGPLRLRIVAHAAQTEAHNGEPQSSDSDQTPSKTPVRWSAEATP